MKGGGTAHSRAAREVMALVRRWGPMTRAEAAGRTGLPKSTVNGVVQNLIDEGALVEEAGGGPAGRRGPVARRVRLASSAGDVADVAGAVGVVALSHGWLRVGVVDPSGRILGRRDVECDPLRPDFDLVSTGEGLLEQARAEAGGTRLSGITVGVPGPFRRGHGLAGLEKLSELLAARHPHAPEPPSWMTGDPAEHFTQRLGLPAVTENDANLGALGEATFGAGVGVSDLIYVKLVEGVGAGVLVGGRLVRGSGGLAGEIAHTQVAAVGSLCPCGRRGCLASVMAAGDLSITVSNDGALVASRGLEHSMTMASYGSSSLAPPVDEALRALGRLLATFCLLLSPAAIVIDGQLADAPPRLLAVIREALYLHSGPLFAGTVDVRIGALGVDAELMGGAALAARELPH